MSSSCGSSGAITAAKNDSNNEICSNKKRKHPSRKSLPPVDNSSRHTFMFETSKPWDYPEAYANMATHAMMMLCSGMNASKVAHDAVVQENQRMAEEVEALKTKLKKAKKKTLRYKAEVKALKVKLEEERLRFKWSIEKARRKQKWISAEKYRVRLDKARASLAKLTEAKDAEMHLAELSGNLRLLNDLERGSTLAVEKAKAESWLNDHKGDVGCFQRAMDSLTRELVFSPVSPYVSECAYGEDPVGDEAADAGVVNFAGTNHDTFDGGFGADFD